MAAIDINEAAPQAFEAGGILTIDDGTNVYTVYAIEPATLEIERGGYSKRKWTDRMVQQQALLGEEQYSTIRLRAKCGNIAESDGLRALSEAISSSNGKVKEYTVVAKTPNYKGATAGSSQTFTNCSFVKPVKITTGAEFDLFEVEFESRDKFGTTATY